MSSTQGKLFDTHLKNLIHSTYQNCFIDWEEQDPDLLQHVEETLRLRFHNPDYATFSSEWLKDTVKNFLRNNKRLGVRKATKAQVDIPHLQKRGGYMHDPEWNFAMEEARSGVEHRHQKKVAREAQQPAHWGLGRKEIWKDKVENLIGVRPFSTMVKYRSKHSEARTWKWMLDYNFISRTQYDMVMATLTTTQSSRATLK